MKKYLNNLKCIVLGIFISLTSCVDDTLPDVGDLPDLTSPTPFYSVADVSSSEFDCSDVELSANYDFNFQAGSNLAVNGTQYLWSVTPSEGLTLINKDLPVLEQSIDAQLSAVVAIESEIEKLEFKIPCESNPDKVTVMEAQIAELEVALQEAEDAVTDEVKENVAALEAQILSLPAATLQDQELIFSFPGPGVYTVGLTVTDELGKSEYTEKIVTVNQAVPTIPVPEISEPGFEDNSLFDGTGDGRASWNVPSPRADWNPFGQDSFSGIQINTKVEGVLPEGTQAAKFPSDGGRVAYQEIEVTPGATYVLTYFTGFNVDAYGTMTVSVLTPETSSYTEAKQEANILGSRTDTNVGRVADVFKKHAITFEAGENESVIIFATNTGVETRLDLFDIVVKQ
ncbi:hypothetical protein BW723_07375 [Polaribacter reichenbachii]|uniref:PKD domain-containing protein n=1 Tax=Polaribacter reichenbachii TaxID=996801 RepID=A0A1B8U6E8_9FLAO|nr:hypothetical protein [Polaribacter reichenbachii]APZ46129.1 hypothetical protein BW723_07375 [Polaribacter reichenbachii]AUC19991.1 hypothetical protein BTO17_15395 [Polaribacter reichenbachii]OBY67463.1 hypothetical protein LPB301_02115 [Polaribacter reichenbachii]